MIGEQDGGKNPLARLIRKDSSTPTGDITAGAIIPLRSEQRKEFPHVIYELESNSPYDHALVLAAHEAMLGAQFPIAIDIERRDYDVKAIVRSSSGERRDQ